MIEARGPSSDGSDGRRGAETAVCSPRRRSVIGQAVGCRFPAASESVLHDTSACSRKAVSLVVRSLVAAERRGDVVRRLAARGRHATCARALPGNSSAMRFSPTTLSTIFEAIPETSNGRAKEPDWTGDPGACVAGMPCGPVRPSVSPAGRRS